MIKRSPPSAPHQYLPKVCVCGSVACVCVGVWRDDCDLQNEMSVTAWYGLRNGQCYVFHRHCRGLPLSLETLLWLYFWYSVLQSMHVTDWPLDNNSPRLILVIMRLYNFLFGILYDPPDNDGCGAISDTVHNMIKIDVTCYSIINFIWLSQ